MVTQSMIRALNEEAHACAKAARKFGDPRAADFTRIASETDALMDMSAPVVRCAVCRDNLHAEDFRPDLWQEHFVAALHDRYGPNVCAGCMDNIDKEGMPE